MTATEFLKEIEVATASEVKATPITHIITTSQGISISAKCAQSDKTPNNEPIDKAKMTDPAKNVFSSASAEGYKPAAAITQDAVAVISSPVIPSSKSAYEKLILQQSTPLKNQIETSQKHSFKAKKFGNLFKLQSIRSAKVKIK